MENYNQVINKLNDTDINVIFCHISLKHKMNIIIGLMVVLIFLSAYGIFVK